MSHDDEKRDQPASKVPCRMPRTPKAKIDVATMLTVTESLLRTKSYDDVDDLLAEVARDVYRYENAALLMLLTQSSWEWERFKNRQGLVLLVEEKLVAELGAVRAANLLRPTERNCQ